MAISRTSGFHLVASLLCGLVAAAAHATAGDVAIRYNLLTSFAGADAANGTIVVQVQNLSSQPLSAVTLRLVDPTLGKITGPVQENIDLASGESRHLEGEFVLDPKALATGHALEWLIVYTDQAGFAHQQTVRGIMTRSLAAGSSQTAAAITPDTSRR